MRDKEPTQEQIKELWEWCGITFTDDGKAWQGNKLLYWYLDETLARESVLPIDLNNLFKYAVPKLEYLNVSWQNTPKPYYRITIRGYTGKSREFTTKDYSQQAETLKLALFWAIYSIIDKR